MKIVIDTDILISAAFFGGIPRKVIQAIVEEKVTACANDLIIEEYEEIKEEMLLRKKGKLSDDIFDSYLRKVKIVDPVTVVDVCRDPDDNKFIACAMDAEAIYVVSGDKDLLAVEHYEEIEIVTAKEFYERYLLSQL